jgi:predicted O-methyltransferase YrrM
MRYYADPLKSIALWTFRSRELANFTYDLTEANKSYLAAFVSAVAGCSMPEAEAYIAEADNDEALRNHIIRETKRSSLNRDADTDVQFGRRLGWYAFVRATKPKLVIETGVDKGLGSCLLCAALMRNAAGGSPGRYVGTDINPHAGYLLAPPYSDFGEIVFGDSLESLRTLCSDGATIDMFINDSDHSAAYEAREYQQVDSNLSRDAIILGDNSHSTSELWKHARATGRAFLFFREQPQDHWYPGAGIGIAYRHDSR